MGSNRRGDRGRRGRTLAGLICVIALVGCGPAATSTDTPAASSGPASPPAAPQSAAQVDGSAGATPTGLDGATLRGAAAADGGVVAVGAEGDRAAAWRSRDGVAWEPVDVQDAGAAQALEAVAFGDRGVAFGAGDAGSPPAWVTDDDASWRLVDALTGVDGRVNAVEVEGGRWIAVGDVVDEETGEAYGGAVWTSDDGTAWRVAGEMTLDEGTVSDVASDGDTTVVVGFDVAGGRMWTSTGDGEFAAVDGEDLAGMTLQGVTALDDGFVVLGRGPDLRAYAWTSPDGATWTRDELPADVVAPDDEIHELTTVGDRALAVGVTAGNGGVWTSRDGRAWTPGS